MTADQRADAVSPERHPDAAELAMTETNRRSLESVQKLMAEAAPPGPPRPAARGDAVRSKEDWPPFPGEHTRPTCGCGYEWKFAGYLHGVSMGNCWIRTTTAAPCTEHGAQRDSLPAEETP